MKLKLKGKTASWIVLAVLLAILGYFGIKLYHMSNPSVFMAILILLVLGTILLMRLTERGNE